MPITYPDGPPPHGWDRPRRLRLWPGEGIRIRPLECREILDFVAPKGEGSAAIVGLLSQLGKWGFETQKIEEWVEVSPLLTEYYERTMRQKAEIERKIKENMEALTRSLTALRGVEDELRLYREYMNYYRQIEKGKELIKIGKVKEGKELKQKGEKTLKHVWIDRVDVHTGPGIALKEIVVKWPTIISDFLKLEDVDVEPEKIAKKYKVSVAEGVILSTKNKLYMEWRDKLFRPKVIKDYERLRSQVEGWRSTWEEYRRMVKPWIARFKSFRDMTEKPENLLRISMWRPGSIAISVDKSLIWAWRPFAPIEKYRIVKEVLEKIPARDAGFTLAEVKELRKKIPDWDGKVTALPLEPSIDRIVRRFIADVNKVWGVKLTAVDLYNARKMFTDAFDIRLGGLTPWVFSPYFEFVELPIHRFVIRLPDGREVEDVLIRTFDTVVETQNLILIRYLEVIARDKKLDQEMRTMVGEAGIREEELIALEEIIRAEYPEIPEVRPKPIKIPALEKLRRRIEDFLTRGKDIARRASERAAKIKSLVGEFLASIGMDIPFLRVIGPYEFFVDRIYSFYLPSATRTFFDISRYLKTSFRVVGEE